MACPRDELGEVERLVERRGDRLLAEGRHAGLEAETDERRVARRRRRDDEAVDARGEQLGGRRGVPDLELVGDGASGVGVQVGHDDLVDVGEVPEGLGVERPDAADSGQSDAHVHTPLGVRGGRRSGGVVAAGSVGSGRRARGRRRPSENDRRARGHVVSSKC